MSKVIALVLRELGREVDLGAGRGLVTKAVVHDGLALTLGAFCKCRNMVRGLGHARGRPRPLDGRRGERGRARIVVLFEDGGRPARRRPSLKTTGQTATGAVLVEPMAGVVLLYDVAVKGPADLSP